jgi:hypothetical protein
MSKSANHVLAISLRCCFQPPGACTNPVLCHHAGNCVPCSVCHPATPLLQVIPLQAGLDFGPATSTTLPGFRRKIIVSTNVAETSHTIQGLCHVIDTGLAKVTSFDVDKGLPMLRAELICQAGFCPCV